MKLPDSRRPKPTLSKRRVGPVLVWTAALLPLVLWFFTEPAAPVGRRASSHLLSGSIGQLAGLVGMAMLSIAFVLASRARFLEDYFGGLDKMYRVHHRLGLTAFVLLLIHPIAHALRFLPDRIGRALRFFFPAHEQLAVNFGVYAFWGLLLLMALTLYTRVPYDKWKLSHKALGLVLILGTMHLLTVEPTPGRAVAVLESSLLRSYLLALAALGLVSFGYKLIVLPLLARRHRYTVQAVHRINLEVLEVTLTPRRGRISFEPGQFVFVTFDAKDLPHEAHPFTICTIPDEKDLTLTIKVLGDFTETLYRRLRPGAGAKLEGPYGRFDYRTGSPRQIWLAGGVGVVPFLSWARYLLHLREEGPQVTFYYCVHSRGDAVHYEEFLRLAAQMDQLQVVLVCSEEQGHLRAADVGDLQGRDLFLCGPKRFTSDLQRQFLKLGVPRERIHFEDFEFR